MHASLSRIKEKAHAIIALAQPYYDQVTPHSGSWAAVSAMDRLRQCVASEAVDEAEGFLTCAAKDIRFMFRRHPAALSAMNQHLWMA